MGAGPVAGVVELAGDVERAAVVGESLLVLAGGEVGPAEAPFRVAAGPARLDRFVRDL